MATAAPAVANPTLAPAAISAADFTITTEANGLQGIPSSSPAIAALASLFNWAAAPSGNQCLEPWQWNQILYPASSYDPAVAAQLRSCAVF